MVPWPERRHEEWPTSCLLASRERGNCSGRHEFEAQEHRAHSTTRARETAFENDEPALFRQTLVRTLWLTVAFLLVQIAAWAWLFSQNLDLKSGQGAGYLYLLSMLHFVHVLAGIPFLWLFLRKFNRQVQMELGGQLFFSDPEKRLQLRLVSMYWHFLDGLWLLLVLFFLVNWLLQ